MKAKVLSNGLSKRTTNCLTKAGFAIEKRLLVKALKAGIIYPYHWPANYGIKTHRELCQWAGVDARTKTPDISKIGVIPYLNNGLSYRANRCLQRGGILATKKSVRRAILAGLLCPGNYGKQTHLELCGWVGIKPN